MPSCHLVSFPNKRMTTVKDIDRPYGMSRAWETILTLLLSFTLVAILLPLPRPELPVNHPYKIELLLSIFLILLLLVSKRKLQVSSQNAESITRFIALSFGLFAVWSAVSILWARASLSVIHHTLSDLL